MFKVRRFCSTSQGGEFVALEAEGLAWLGESRGKFGEPAAGVVIFVGLGFSETLYKPGEGRARCLDLAAVGEEEPAERACRAGAQVFKHDANPRRRGQSRSFGGKFEHHCTWPAAPPQPLAAHRGNLEVEGHTGQPPVAKRAGRKSESAPQPGPLLRPEAEDNSLP